MIMNLSDCENKRHVTLGNDYDTVDARYLPNHDLYWPLDPICNRTHVLDRLFRESGGV